MKRDLPLGHGDGRHSGYNDAACKTEHAALPSSHLSSLALFGSRLRFVVMVMAHISSGSQLGPYELEALIGKGGTGEVYRAHDSRLNRRVALKVLAPKFTADADRLARFTQEARTTALLNHPNVIAVYDVGTHLGVPFVVSELLDGETLRARIAGGALPLSTALTYGLELARGLVAAHSLGITHRDLKPENVFVTRDDRVKILDFGLATCREAALACAGPDSSTSSGGGMVGTIGYAAPEQIRGARNHLVKHHAEAEDIRSVISAVAADLFRRRVADGSNHSAARRGR